MDTVKADFYAQIEPELSRYSEERVIAAKVVKLTQKKPKYPERGTVVVKLTIEIPTAAFLPLRPEAVITIPAELAHPVPIEVTASDPNMKEDEDEIQD